jgi:hypothetical protein
MRGDKNKRWYEERIFFSYVQNLLGIGAEKQGLISQASGKTGLI